MESLQWAAIQAISKNKMTNSIAKTTVPRLVGLTELAGRLWEWHLLGQLFQLLGCWWNMGSHEAKHFALILMFNVDCAFMASLYISFRYFVEYCKFKSFRRCNFWSVSNAPSAVIRPSVWAAVSRFLYTLKWLSSSLFYLELIYFNI